VFDYVRYVHEATEVVVGKPGKKLVVWMRNNTSWSCGSCMGASPSSVGSDDFDAQIWIPSEAQSQSYWSDATTSHELGHWTMSSYGTSPKEGGPHTASCPTFPGQAYSEGFATWFSSLTRGSSKFYNKASGSFFWFDIGSKTYPGGQVWQLPTASQGLLQMMDENEVASILWQLTTQDEAPLNNAANWVFFTALQAPGINKPYGVPYGRGYYRHTWTAMGGTCGQTNVQVTGLSRPMLADYLDALVCNGVSASAVDGATNPAVNYPYPSASPICN
jgi:hypothetical protein